MSRPGEALTAVKQAFVAGLHQGSFAAAGAAAAAALVALAFLPARPGARDDHAERSVASPAGQPGLATAGLGE